MSKWKPIGELKNSHTGYAWLRHQDCVSLGWKTIYGDLRYSDGEINLGDSPTHFLFCDQTRPVVKAKKKSSKPSSWVRVEDQKPKAGKVVLVVESDVVTDPVRPAYYNAPSHDFRTPGKHIPLENVTHWRPLPKGPKGNE